MSGFTSTLLAGVAQHLADSGVGVWNPTGIYAATDTAIVIGTLPQEPARAIALMAYGVSDDPTLPNSVIGVQVRCRWDGPDPSPAADLADAVFDILHSMRRTLPGGVSVTQSFRSSGPLPLGQDNNQRWQNSSNYYMTVWRPSPNRE